MNAPLAVSAQAKRIETLDEALQLGWQRVDPEVLDRVGSILERSRDRRRLSSDHTVIGFFGATGSGKSSLYNAVIGEAIAKTAARRPTTSSAQAAVWGRQGSEEILDWLQVNNRVYLDQNEGTSVSSLNSAEVPVDNGLWNRVKSMVGRAETITQTGGLILLDLPDFDSVEAANRQLVQRMTGLVDVLVWVFDPQKYADAVIHRDFIAPLAEHGAVTMAVLNQSDRLDGREIPTVLDSLQYLLAEDGLMATMLSAPLAVSARTGDGIERLRTALGRVAVEKSAALQRIDADLDAAVADLEFFDGGGVPDGITGSGIRMLERGLYEASGAGAVVQAAGQSYRLHAAHQTGWILTRWLLRFRQDPLKRLNLHRQDSGSAITRSSLPGLGAGQKSAISSAIRRFSAGASEGVREPWSHSIRDAARSREEDIPQNLERAIAQVEYRGQKNQWWWYLLNGFQWLGLLFLLAGLLWLTGLALAAYFRLELPDPPKVAEFPLPLPTVLVMTGLVLGLVTALFGRLFAVIGYRIYCRRISASIFENIKALAENLVVSPVRTEIHRHQSFCDALGDAR